MPQEFEFGRQSLIQNLEDPTAPKQTLVPHNSALKSSRFTAAPLTPPANFLPTKENELNSPESGVEIEVLGDGWEATGDAKVDSHSEKLKISGGVVIVAKDHGPPR